MSYTYLTTLADDLRAADIRVVEYPGWKTRGHDPKKYKFIPKFVMWHHDASPAGPSPSLPAYIAKGNDSLDGPFAHAWVATDGTWHLIAAGHAFHAGKGGPYAGVPKDVMNTYSFGIEVDHTVREEWPYVQLASLRKGTAVVLKRLGTKPDPYLLFHKTWSSTGKVDPDGLSLATEQALVSAELTLLNQPVVTPANVQVSLPAASAIKTVPLARGVKPWRKHPQVKLLQSLLIKAGYGPIPGSPTDYYGGRTQDAVARFHNANPKFKSKLRRDVAIGAKGFAEIQRQAGSKTS